MSDVEKYLDSVSSFLFFYKILHSKENDDVEGVLRSRGRSAGFMKVLIQCLREAESLGSDGYVSKTECNAHMHCSHVIICGLSDECRETPVLKF